MPCPASLWMRRTTNNLAFNVIPATASQRAMKQPFANRFPGDIETIARPAMATCIEGSSIPMKFATTTVWTVTTAISLHHRLSISPDTHKRAFRSLVPTPSWTVSNATGIFPWTVRLPATTTPHRLCVSFAARPVLADRATGIHTEENSTRDRFADKIVEPVIVRILFAAQLLRSISMA